MKNKFQQLRQSGAQLISADNSSQITQHFNQLSGKTLKITTF